MDRKVIESVHLSMLEAETWQKEYRNVRYLGVDSITAELCEVIEDADHPRRRVRIMSEEETNQIEIWGMDNLEL